MGAIVRDVFREKKLLPVELDDVQKLSEKRINDQYNTESIVFIVFVSLPFQ